MDENDGPEWLRWAAQQVDAVIRQQIPFLRAAQQYVKEARAAEAAAGPSLPSGGVVALAMDAGMRELLAVARQQAVHRTGSVRGYASSTDTATGSAVVWDAPVYAVVVSDSGVATDSLIVQEQDPSDPGMPLDAKTVFLAVLWIFTILLPLKIELLSPEAQTIIRDYVAIVGVALVIHWRVQDGRKRD